MTTKIKNIGEGFSPMNPHRIRISEIQESLHLGSTRLEVPSNFPDLPVVISDTGMAFDHLQYLSTSSKHFSSRIPWA